MQLYNLLALISSKLKLPFKAEMMSAPKAPTPAASVGVAMPAMIDPRTTKIRVVGGRRVLNIFTSSTISSVRVNSFFD